MKNKRTPGWLSWLSNCLQVRSWPQGPGFEARTERAGSLLLPLSATPLLLLALSQINKTLKKNTQQ